MIPGESDQKAGKDASVRPTKEPPDTHSNPLPSISLPKGGGAIRGIGEKFSANPVTGTGSLDPVGNITEIQDEAQQTIFFNNAKVAPSMQYAYDALCRLTQASGREHAGQNAPPPPHWAPEFDYNDFLRTGLPQPNDWSAMQNYTEEYAYDHVGNITSMTHSAGSNTAWKRRYDYPADSNRLRSTSLPGDSTTGPFSARYSYDIHGNMTSMPHLPQMQWDFKNRLHQVDLGGGGTAYYVYDASGQRVRKVVESGSLIKERIYVGGYEIYREHNGSGPTLERETLHVMDDKKRVALVETKAIDTQDATDVGKPLLRYQLDNHLGSALLELDNTGAVISYEEYYPYGGTSYQAGLSKAEVSLKRYRYTGKERDEESGLYYHGARYYACWLGRWTSCDPIGMMDGSNLYQYVTSSPTSAVDRTGTNGEQTQELDRSLFDITSKRAVSKSVTAPNRLTEAEFKRVNSLYVDIQKNNIGFPIKDQVAFKKGVLLDIARILQTKVGRQFFETIASKKSIMLFYPAERTSFVLETLKNIGQEKWIGILGKEGQKILSDEKLSEKFKQGIIQEARGLGENYFDVKSVPPKDDQHFSAVAYAPGENVSPLAAESEWLPIRSDVVLFHELIHTQEDPELSRDTREYKAVGLYQYEKTEPFTENKYREERRYVVGKGHLREDPMMPKRERYQYFEGQVWFKVIQRQEYREVIKRALKTYATP